MFACAVARVERHADLGLNGGDDHDLPAAFPECGQRRVNTVGDAKKIDFHQAAKQLKVFDILKPCPHTLAGVGDEVVENAILSNNFSNELFAVVFCSHIPGEDERVIAKLSGGFLQPPLVAGHEGQARAVRGEFAGELQAKPA